MVHIMQKQVGLIPAFYREAPSLATLTLDLMEIIDENMKTTCPCS